METKLYKKVNPIGLIKTPTETYYVLSRVTNGRFEGVPYKPSEQTEHGYWYARIQVIEVHGTYTHIRWNKPTQEIMVWTGEYGTPQEETEQWNM